ncbi:MAG: GNAT family N-acetyltransferase [Bacteroidia bacterium]
MVRFISPEDTLELRSKMLRNNLPKDACIFPSDRVKDAFHLGCFVEEQLVSIASFHPMKYKTQTTPGYQLRGMATGSAHTGKGYGAELIDFAIEQLNATNATHLWCNARTSAVGFYLKKGFEVVSAEFEVPEVGPHYEMIINLKI